MMIYIQRWMGCIFYTYSYYILLLLIRIYYISERDRMNVYE